MRTAKLARWPLVVLVALTAAGSFLAVEAFVAPPAHPVHSPGGTPVAPVAYRSTSDLWWITSAPTESLAQVSCREWRTDGRPPCTADFIATQVHGLKQAEHTLYYVWSGCVNAGDIGPIIPWAGSNVEYFEATRTLVLHCYVGTPWVYRPQYFAGVGPEGGYLILLAIPTSDMGAGTLDIREDDRLEHLVGDQSKEYDLATATIT